MKGYLANLEEALFFLEEKERNKVLEEYEQKIKEWEEDGKKEKEILKELGSVEEVSSKISQKYHINPVIAKPKKGNILNRGIETCAGVLVELVNDIAYYVKRKTTDHALETFFEVLLKLILLFLAILILKLPFYLLEGLVDFFFHGIFYPFDGALYVLFNFSLSVLYFVSCAIVAVFLFLGSEKPKKKVEQEEKIVPKKDEKQKAKEKNYVVFFLKAILYVIAVLPMSVLVIVLLGMVGLSFFLVYQGISLMGLCLVLMAYFLFSVLITAYLVESLEEKKKNHRATLFTAILMLFIGHVFLIFDLLSFSFPATLEGSSFQPDVETKTITIPGEVYVSNLWGDVSVKEKEDLADDEVLMQVSYFDEVYDVDVRILQDDETNYLIFRSFRDAFDMEDISYYYKHSVEDLKNSRIYDYSRLDEFDVVLYANTKTLQKINY